RLRGELVERPPFSPGIQSSLPYRAGERMARCFSARSLERASEHRSFGLDNSGGRYRLFLRASRSCSCALRRLELSYSLAAHPAGHGAHVQLGKLVVQARPPANPVPGGFPRHTGVFLRLRRVVSAAQYRRGRVPSPLAKPTQTLRSSGG